MVTSSVFVSCTIAAMVVSPVISTFADAAGIDMPWFANTGVAGMCGFLLWWSMERGDRRSTAAIEDLKDELGGMRSDLTSGQDKTNELLTKALFQNRHP